MIMYLIMIIIKCMSIIKLIFMI